MKKLLLDEKELKKANVNNFNFPDFVEKNIGSYNVVFKYAPWIWRIYWITLRFVYLYLILIAGLYCFYGFVPKLPFLLNVLFFLPIVLSVFLFVGTGNKVIKKHYSEYRGISLFKALPKIQRALVESELRLYGCFNLDGFQKASDVIFREEQSRRQISIFQVLFVGAFIPITTVLLNWMMPAQNHPLLDALIVIQKFIAVIFVIGFIVFFEEYIFQDSKGQKLKQTRVILDSLYFEQLGDRETKGPSLE